MKTLLVYAALSLLQPPDTTSNQTPAVAVIYELSGEALVTPVGGESTRSARLFDWLRDGTRMRLEEGSRISLAFVNGARYKLSGPATAELNTEGFGQSDGKIEAQSPIPPLPPRAALERATLADTELGGVVLRGSGPSWIYPRLGATTLAHDTTLRFGGSEAPNGFRVVLEDESGVVLLHSIVRDPEVRVEPGLLHEDRVYFWRVITLGEAGILGSAEGEFRTLDAVSSADRKRLQEELGSSSDPHLLGLLAEADRRLGLVWEALTTLRRAQALLPDDSEFDERCEALDTLLRRS